MYITNIKHLLDASEKMPNEMPREARDLIGFLTLIIDKTTINLPHTLTSTDIHCFEKGCDGLIKTALRVDTNEIHWFCPDCEDEGLISDWKDTEWDNSSRNK
jgi:RNase P subunit RPR2